MNKDADLAKLLASEGISDTNVLRAIAAVKRINFVSADLRSAAYLNRALPIDCGQTISQPYVVARMTELMLAGRNHLNRVLEIGTGSGYQAAVLAQVADEVYSIERIEQLYLEVSARLKNLGYEKIHCLFADGRLGYAEAKPYAGILVTAASHDVPPPLLEQLDPNGGVLVIPVATRHGYQELQQITRHDDEYDVAYYDPVEFVPLKHGRAGK